MGIQNCHNVPFLESASLKKRKRNVMKRIKQFYKISKKGSKKKSCHLVPKVVTDLPFEGRKVEGSQKYRRRERVPKAGSRGEETSTGLINSRIGEFHTIVVGKCCLTCGTWPSHWRWNTGGQFITAVTKGTAVEKRQRSNLAAKRQRVKSRGQGGITNQADSLWFNPIEKRSIRGRTPDMRAIFQAGTNKSSIQFE